MPKLKQNIEQQRKSIKRLASPIFRVKPNTEAPKRKLINCKSEQILNDKFKLDCERAAQKSSYLSKIEVEELLIDLRMLPSVQTSTSSL